MPDKWEYPWYAGWGLAFHCIPLVLVEKLPVFNRQSRRAIFSVAIQTGEDPSGFPSTICSSNPCKNIITTRVMISASNFPPVPVTR